MFITAGFERSDPRSSPARGFAAVGAIIMQNTKLCFFLQRQSAVFCINLHTTRPP